MSTQRSARSSRPSLQNSAEDLSEDEKEHTPPASKRRKLQDNKAADSTPAGSRKSTKKLVSSGEWVSIKSARSQDKGKQPTQTIKRKGGERITRDVYEFTGDDDGDDGLLDCIKVRASIQPSKSRTQNARRTITAATNGRYERNAKKGNAEPTDALKHVRRAEEIPQSPKSSRGSRVQAPLSVKDDNSSLRSITPVKQGRGRPKKLGSEVTNSIKDDTSSMRSLSPVKRGRGRPKKGESDVAEEPNFEEVDEEGEGDDAEEDRTRLGEYGKDSNEENARSRPSSPTKRGRGRPRRANTLKVEASNSRNKTDASARFSNGETNTPRRGQGRPKKTHEIRTDVEEGIVTATTSPSKQLQPETQNSPVPPEKRGKQSRTKESIFVNGKANGNQNGHAEDSEDDIFSTVVVGGGHGSSKLIRDLKNAVGEQSSEDEESGVESVASLTRLEKTALKTKYIGMVTEEGVKSLKRHVLGKLTGRKLPGKLVGLKEEYNNVHHLLEQTVTMGEGNSIILIGPRGSGKTAMTESSIAALQKGHGKDFLVVRLNGFVQTDEKSAVKEIWRQLGSAMEIDEERPINFADTLTSILALLSHPSEQDNGGLTETALESTTSVSVFFLISEFDLFAAHPRQTLLYNLFDIAQAKKAPIAVVGMTTRIDVVEMLEKRVKSRFSHRTIGVKVGGNLGSRIDGWWEVVKATLCVDEDTIAVGVEHPDKPDRDYFREWNKRIDIMFKEDKIFRQIANAVYAKSKDVKSFLNHCLVPISELSTKQPFLDSGAALLENALVPPENKLYLLAELPELSLSLLICAARLDPILETDTCNFTMAYDEYKTLVGRVKVASQSTWAMKVWGKEVALAAWEKLAEWELIVPATGGGGGGGAVIATAVGGREARMFRVDVGLLEIKRQGRDWGMSTIFNNWCSIG